MSHLSSTPVIARIFLLAGVLLAILALLSPSSFPAYAQEAMDETIDYPENGTDSVAVFTAMDPEGEDITWSLTGVDAADFDGEGGVLTFNDPPNFEAPADDDTNNEYTVIVNANDGTETATRMVTVNVTNVDEDGDITLSTLQPLEKFTLTATLTDLDGGPNVTLPITTEQQTNLTDEDTTKWQWSRSSDVDGPWTDIEADATSNPPITSDMASYTPGPDDVRQYLRATARYTDGHSPTDTEDPDKTEHMVSANPVLKNLVNDDPVFIYAEGDTIPDTAAVGDMIPDGDPVIRKVDENSASGTAVGAPVAAYDEDEDVLTYTLEPTTSFTIDRGTGQIKVGTTLDFETTTTYTVTVTATDPSGESGGDRDTITVTINVTDVDEDPTINAAALTSINFVENAQEQSPNTQVTDPFMATDPEDVDAELEWSLSGSDRGQFDISATGVLTFKSPPDFEAPADSGRDNIYNVTVVVTDSGSNTDMVPVTVTIKNFEEPGTVVLLFASVQPETFILEPEVGTRIRAKLTDPDGRITGLTWQWESGGSPITSTTSATYTPVVADEDTTLSVTATYDDGFDTGNTAEAAFSEDVKADDTNNKPPVFSDQSPTRTVAEDAATANDLPIGLPVAATDDPATEDDNSGDTLSYALSGRDAAFFTINEGTGLISVVAGTMLDHETKPNYTVTVKATDPSGASATVTVTIEVTNVVEPPSITAGDAAIDYTENSTGAVSTYRATDPEDDRARPQLPLTWSLSGNDDDQLAINTTSGVLTFVRAPDYEDPADDGGNNEYNVTVTVTDDDETTDERVVVITVTNVDEDGDITLTTLQPLEDVLLTATLTDLDGQPNRVGTINTDLTDLTATTKWQWARSSNAGGPWTDIEASDTPPLSTSNTKTYTPGPDDEGHYLRATATYTDGHSPTDTEDPDKTESVVSANPVLKNLVNDVPVFNYTEGDTIPDTADEGTSVGDKIPDEEPVIREVDENSASGTAVGAPVAAYDEDRDVLTYTLTGDDVGLFSIDRGTGQIKVGTTLDFEASKNTYSVEVKATDPSGLFDTINVTIMVTNVDEAPELAEPMGMAGLTEKDYDENAGTTTEVSTYSATDDEDDEDNNLVLKWSLSGLDSDKFEISTTGALTFKSSPDYEAPADSGRNNVYNVTVIVTDSDEMTDSRDVVVTVTNVDEPGTVTLSNLQPEDGVPIRATLTNPDRGVTDLKWQWSFGGSPGGTFTPIAGATSDTYTPTTPNVGQYLRATATYADNAMGADDSSTNDIDESQEDSAATTATFTVQAQDDANEPPEFPDQDNIATGRQTDQTRYVLESAIETALVVLNEDGAMTADGDPVTATDSEGTDPIRTDVLTYTLSGPDAGSFKIDRATGQISVGDETELDYEARKTYTVRVTATDPSLVSDTITVTIKVTDVNEAPEIMKRALTIEGDRSISYSENDTADVATYTATGPDSAGATWTLLGDDDGDFSISSGGVLTFRSSPNFENPADRGANNVYNVIVMASSGDVNARLNVTVTVTNEDDAGTVTLSSDQNEVKVGVAITAEVTDLDVVDPITVTWQWASSANAAGPWADIAGATDEAYTPVEDDVGNYLQATASYRDGHGSGKSESAATTSVVLALTTDVIGDNGVVTLSSNDPVMGQALTASLADSDSPISITWQWASSSTSSGTYTDIAGATTEVYTPAQGDVGNYLRATASYEDDQGPGQTASAATTSPVLTAGTIVDNGVVTLSSNSPVMGEALTASLTDPDNPTGITWQWASSSTASGTYTDITGATTDTYTPVQGDVGNYLQATASYTDAQGSGQSASAATANAINAATTTPIHKYDSNGDGSIQRTEVIDAINAFLLEKTATRDEVIEVINLYLLR